MAHVITQSCCSDASCVPVCPVNCIHPTPDEPDFGKVDMLYIDPDSCIDCGACIDVCPVEAVVADYELEAADLPFADLNASYYHHRSAAQDHRPPVTAAERPTLAEPLTIAIVGTGPSACFAAESLLAQRDTEVTVTMFERLPTPWGLARYGVAPDHQQTKLITDLFTATTGRRSLTMLLNVEVGQDITHEQLLETHHAVIYAAGSPDSRPLGIPGEELPGSYAAGDFVGWYNGHPDRSADRFPFHSERVVIVGNGNVALDAARILLSDVATLERSDIANHSLDALHESKVREVVLLGRRGPAEAAFTAKELIPLIEYDGIDIAIDGADLDAVGEVVGQRAYALSALREAAARPRRAQRTLRFQFFSAPVAVAGRSAVEGLDITRSVPGTAAVKQTIDCGMILRSIGFRARRHSGLPFDEDLSVIPNVGGRVTDEHGNTQNGVYVTGWLARGASGAIGTNRRCAAATVAALLEDASQGSLTSPTNVLNHESLTTAIDLRGWHALDRHELAAGRVATRPRVKVTDLAEMLAIARG